MTKTIRVLHVGLGPIGAAVARQVIERAGFEAVAAVDIDREKVGQELGEICGLTDAPALRVVDDLEGALAAAAADVVALCTGSSLAGIVSQVEAILDAGLPIVSTTEELAHPWSANASLARHLDERARVAGVAVVGTGVNPGFAMDSWPILLTAVCERVDAVVVERVQDAGRRRLPFQQKIGAGLEQPVFRARREAGELGHVGLTESITMIAAALGWRLERITDEVEPVIAERRVASELLAVEPGRVRGIVQDGVGYRRGEPVIRLHMEAYLGAPESYDSVRIVGSPPLEARIVGGIPGDIATASVAVNTLPRVLAASPGLHTMRDLPIPSWWAGSDQPKKR